MAIPVAVDFGDVNEALKQIPEGCTIHEINCPPNSSTGRDEYDCWLDQWEPRYRSIMGHGKSMAEAVTNAARRAAGTWNSTAR